MHEESGEKRVLEAVSFEEFEPHSYESWKEEAISALKGAPFEKKLFTKTYEGITLEPIYTRENVRQTGAQAQPPGCAPYIRGTSASGYIDEPWTISQYVNALLSETANQVLKEELGRGNQAVHLALSRSTLRCQDEPDPEEGLGVHIATLADLQAALDGVDLTGHTLQMYTGPGAAPVLGMFAALAGSRGEGETLRDYSGYVGADPIGYLAEEGELPCPLETLYDEMAAVIRWAGENLPNCRTILVRGDVYHNGGANANQEVGYSFAAAIQYIDALLARGLDIEQIAGQIAFSFSLGANFFMEIAKLRAARGVWSEIIAAYGGSEQAQKLCVLARTSAFTTTAYDPYVNILRASSQTFSGVVGGIDGLSVTPFDEAVRGSDAQSRRIARNIQLMFQNEFDMLQPVDPAGGSWYVESLTAQLGEAIWGEVQQVEREGGLLRQLQAGSVQSAVEQVLQARHKKLATRADRAVGSNMYANMTEQPLAQTGEAREQLVEKRVKAVKDQLSRVDGQRCDAGLKRLTGCLGGEPAEAMSAVADAFLAGATLNQVRQALGGGSGGPAVTPVRQARWTEPFEQLRGRTERYERETGKTVDVFLANMGPVTQHKARADFITGFMEVAHFKVLGNTGFATVEEAAKAAVESGAGVIVICSSDPTYPELVPPLARLIKKERPQASVYLAGAPAAEFKDAYLEAGVDDFIHVKSDCLAMLTAIQQKEGVR